MKLESFGDVFEPSEAVEPILAKPVRQALTEWLAEIWAEEELRAVGIKPRRKALFDGKPGTGKTTLAHHIAARLGLRMLAVRPDKLVSKWIGETSQRLGALFEMAAIKGPKGELDREPIVLFLDEFDAISRQRRRAEQGADDSRNEEVNTLLQRLEQHDGFVIAATNYGDHIDQAIWRRFDMHITIDLPGQSERERILARYLVPFVLPKRSLVELAKSMETASPDLMRKFAENLKRAIVVGPMIDADMSREATIVRVITSIHPHPDLGLPALWARGASDNAVKVLPWPLSKEALPIVEDWLPPMVADKIVPLFGKS